jgi:hypothetical protein
LSAATILSHSSRFEGAVAPSSETAAAPAMVEAE